MIFRYLFFALLGFCLGGILFSYHIPKILKGIDITELSDDHNPGTANAIKYAGVNIGIVCLICDLLKGFLPVSFLCRFTDCSGILFSAAIAAPVLGHAMAPFYKDKSGKAIAVSFGSLLGLLPLSYIVFILAILYIFFSVIIVINPHSRRSIITYFSFAAISLVLGYHNNNMDISIACVAISSIVMYKHHLLSVCQRKRLEDL